jgi:multiple sugar transport system ATP-binding protein
MRAALLRLHERLGVTTVFVTHDQVEAMTLGQRVVVLRDGQVQQIDTPQNLFNAPANLFVAAFIGSPSMNLVEGQIEDDQIRFGGFGLPLPAGRELPRGRVLVGIRPTDFEHTSTADPALPRIRVRPEIAQGLGAETLLLFHIDAPRVSAEAVQAATDTAAEEQTLFADSERAEFTAQIDSRALFALGGEVELAVHIDGLHFFDIETGVAAGGSAATPPAHAPRRDPVTQP